MKMKKIIWFVVLIILVMGGMWVGGNFYPRYTSRLMGFGFFLLLDISLWNVFISNLPSKKQFFSKLLKIAYWVPLGFLIFFIILSFIWPLKNWPAILRIYSPGMLIPLFIWKLILVISMVLGLIISVFGQLFNWILKTSIKKYFALRFMIAFGMVTATLMSFLMISGFIFWVYDFKVRTIELKIAGLPTNFDGVKLVQLSDIHLGSWYSDRPLRKAIEMVEAQKPDIILFTGDLVNYVTDEAYPFESALSLLKAPMGVYAILGNHDYGDYVGWKSEQEHLLNNEHLQDFYSKLNWNCLNNSHRILKKDNDSIVLAGVENWSAKAIWGKKGNLAKAIQGAEDISTMILLSHDPTHWKAEVIPAYPGIDLTLSGHTHAMQMGWETGKYRWSPAKWVYNEWAGIYEHQSVNGNKQYLYVNRGLGHIGFPGRIGMKPEITVIILRKE
jgi:predicted MPP superfamily phosphohydrolase